MSRPPRIGQTTSTNRRPTSTPQDEVSPDRTHPGDASTLLHLAPPSLSALVSQNELKGFILDYFLVNVFPDTALAFARESNEMDKMDRNNNVFVEAKGKRGGDGMKEPEGMEREERLDQDGDEAMIIDETGEGTKVENGEIRSDNQVQDWPMLSKEELDSIKLRRGTSSLTPRFVTGENTQNRSRYQRSYPSRSNSNRHRSNQASLPHSS